MWTVRINTAEFDLIMQGKIVEKFVEGGLIIIQQADDTPSMQIRFMTREEAGLRFDRGVFLADEQDRREEPWR